MNNLPLSPGDFSSALLISIKMITYFPFSDPHKRHAGTVPPASTIVHQSVHQVANIDNSNIIIIMELNATCV